MIRTLPGNPQVDRIRYLLALASSQSGASFPSGTGIVEVINGSAALATARLPYTTANLYIDPADSTGHASDSNPGTDPNFPLATTPAVNEKLWMRDVQVNATITYLSDDNSNVGLDLSTVTCLDYVNFSLTFQGTPVVLRTGHTFSAVQAMDPATNTRQTVTDGTFDFSTLSGDFIVDRTGGNAGTAAIITEGTTSPVLTPPWTTGDAQGTFTVGDAYEVVRGSHLTLAPGPAFMGRLVFNDFSFTTNSIGPMSGQSANVFTAFRRCQWADFLPIGGIFLACHFPAGIQSFELPFLLACDLVTTHFDVLQTPLQLDADTLIRGYGLIVGPLNYLGVQIVSFNGAGAQFQGTTGPGALQFWGDGDAGKDPGGGGSALLWGTGNAGAGILVGPGATATLAADRLPIVTGAHDYAFVDVDNAALITNARAVAEDGTISAASSTTWANFAGALAGQAHYLPTNASLVAVSVSL